MSRPDSQSMDAESASNMTGTYARVIVLEAVTIVLLWLVGRMFS